MIGIFARAFHEGGWGMWPTLAFGLTLLGAAGVAAARPLQRNDALLIGLGLATLVSGALGFLTGVMATIGHVTALSADHGRTLLVGVAESMNNLGLALALTLLGTLGFAVAAARTPGATTSPRS